MKTAIINEIMGQNRSHLNIFLINKDYKVYRIKTKSPLMILISKNL